MPTIKYLCDEIAAELKRRGLTIRNTVTGRTVESGEDVFNFDSHGELVHIWEWYETLFPDRVGPNGELLEKEQA